MLQIISGKFFEDGEIVHNECNGILYSNVAFHSMHPIEYENIKINTVDWHPGYPCYVISYDNCIEHTPKTSILVKIGDNVVIEQLKYILSFSLNAIFDESASVIENLCRRGNAHDNYISSYVTETFDKERNFTREDWEYSIQFYKKMMHLARDEYKIVMRCLAASSFYKRSEEHTSELQSRSALVCRLLLEKKEWAAPAILFACLVFTLTAPTSPSPGLPGGRPPLWRTFKLSTPAPPPLSMD